MGKKDNINEHLFQEYRDFFKHCTATIEDIYSQKQTEPTLFMEKGDGRAASLYLMGPYGRIFGITLWSIDKPQDRLMVETKDHLKMVYFRLYIDYSCMYSLIDIIYMVLQVCGQDAATQSLNDYCDKNTLQRPHNLLSDWDNDPTWGLLQTPMGQDFMTDNQLEFKPASKHSPLNELTMNIPTTRGEYMVQTIQTGIRGRLSIHTIDNFRTAVLMDPAVGLGGVFVQYLNNMKILTEIKGISRVPVHTRYKFKHIAPYIGKCVLEARSLSRFGVTTHEKDTSMYQSSRKNPNRKRDIHVCFEKTNYTTVLPSHLLFGRICLTSLLKAIPFYNITNVGRRPQPKNRVESNIMVNRELGLVSKYPTIQLYTTPAIVEDIDLDGMVDYLNQITRTRDSKLTTQKE